MSLHGHRHRYTLELLAAFLNATVLVEQRLKHSLACRRPVEFSPQIQPMIQTPGHSAFPSGHATEAFMAAFVIFALVHEGRTYQPDARDKGSRDAIFEQLMRHAERIAINRTVAGVHFPVDSAAGMILGWCLSEYWLARCCEQSRLTPRTFDGREFTGDFTYTNILDSHGGQGPDNDGGQGPAQSAVLNYLWQKALAEWS